MEDEGFEATNDPSLRLMDIKTAAKLQGSGRGGGKPHVSTIFRWIQDGIRLRSGGRLYLQAVRVPSGWRTTRRWLTEFYDALTADRLGRDRDDEIDGTPRRRRSVTERRAASRQAGELLKQLGR